MVDVLARVSQSVSACGGGNTGGAHIVDHLLDAHAQFVLLAVGAFNGGERGVDAISCGASHVVNEVGKVLRSLELDLARGGVHCV